MTRLYSIKYFKCLKNNSSLPSSRGRQVINNRGVTLIELMVTTVLGSIVILSAVLSCYSTLEAIRRGYEEIELQQEGALALECIKKKIRRGNNITVTPNGAIQIIVTGEGMTEIYKDEDDNLLKFRQQGRETIIAPNSDNYTVSAAVFGEETNGIDITLTLTNIKTGKTVEFSTIAFVRVPI